MLEVVDYTQPETVFDGSVRFIPIQIFIVQ
jgi:hypothetical protein